MINTPSGSYSQSEHDSENKNPVPSCLFRAIRAQAKTALTTTTATACGIIQNTLYAERVYQGLSVEIIYVQIVQPECFKNISCTYQTESTKQQPNDLD